MFPELFDAVPDALVVVDGQGRIVNANNQAERLFGYPRHSMVGIEIEKLIPENARARHRSHRDGYMARPHVRPMGATGQTLVGQRRDGVQFPVEIALSPMHDEQGLNYLASIRDISETQRARQALVRASYDTLVARIGQLALESDDESGVIERVPSLLADALSIEAVAIAFVASDGQTIEVRASAGLDAGLEGDDSASSVSAIARSLSATLAGAQPLSIEDFAAAGAEAAEFPIRLGPGGSGVLMPLFDRSRPMGALIAASTEPRRFDHDALHLVQSVANLIAALVQRRRTEEQLAHSQRLDAIGQLTGGIAHDFNNLLTVMSGSLQLLEDECGQSEAAGELIASALRSVGRGAELTGKLLAFARRQRLMPQPVDPRSLLRDVELMLKRTLGDTIRLQVSSTSDLPSAFVDPTQLDAALVNLALNARDAMPVGGEIAIDARVRHVGDESAIPDLPAGQYVLITVTDTGRGMTPDTLVRAMDPFFTTKEAGRGSGLGLSMVYGFAKQSGGHLRIESTLGYGTRVELYLPAAPGAAIKPTPAKALASEAAGECVLVVEDDAGVRNIAVAFLRASGYEVRAVDSAEAAMQCLSENSDIDLLFSDVMLGNGSNGKELARAARAMRPNLAVLLTSGYEDDAIAKAAGADALELLRKPYRREQLVSAIRRTLQARSKQ
jgi:PAS domain S-box-containing protein